MNPHSKQVLALVLLGLSLCSSSLSFSSSASHDQDEIVLAEGTPINVITAQEITSKEAKPNDPVNFTVNEDLLVNGQVIVRKGTPALGSVINAEKGGYMGKSGKLAVQVESTTTVDGQRLKLRAAKGREGNDKTTSTFALSMISPFFLFKKGGEAKITVGMPVTVYVAEERRFRLDGSTLVAIVPEVPAAASTEEATVYIYRPKKWVGRALEPSVFVDDVELARMDNGRYFAFKMKPGKHIVHMTDDKKGYAIDMGPGQTYYFRVGLEAGMWKGHGKITLDDAERGIKEIKKLKFLGQDKIKAPTVVVEITPK
jgi:Protein of unknown function (DUF2846)